MSANPFDDYLAIPRLHKYYTHTECDSPGSCPYCDGGLAFCTVCKGAEAELTEECPGRAMTKEELERVAAGTLNFNNGMWVVVSA